jgi:DNA-binding transcriptional regulator/RsmH inhibitor MraZ
MDPGRQPPVEAPRGMFPGHFDDKGRVKLPVDLQKYFGSLPEKKLFITSLNRKVAQIYPIAVWRENENFFESYRDNPKAARNTAFNAADLGSESEMDAQGRILFPPKLRRELGLENQTVQLYAHRRRIEVLSEAIYQERKRQAAEAAEADLEVLEAAGLN